MYSLWRTWRNKRVMCLVVQCILLIYYLHSSLCTLSSRLINKACLWQCSLALWNVGVWHAFRLALLSSETLRSHELWLAWPHLRLQQTVAGWECVTLKGLCCDLSCIGNQQVVEDYERGVNLCEIHSDAKGHWSPSQPTKRRNILYKITRLKQTHTHRSERIKKKKI